MLYDTIELLPQHGFGVWNVTHSRVPGDREPRKKYLPHGLGFFHYPRKWGVKRGFDALKAAMVKRHKDEIARLEKSLAALLATECP